MTVEVTNQGGGVSLITFSASAGGTIYNHEPQAVDYNASPRGGVLVVPDSGERIYYANYLHSGREGVAPALAKTGDSVWAAAGELYVHTSRVGSIVRVYTPDGVLSRRHTILVPGLTKLPLAEGVYIVTLNNGAGWKVVSF